MSKKRVNSSMPSYKPRSIYLHHIKPCTNTHSVHHAQCHTPLLHMLLIASRHDHISWEPTHVSLILFRNITTFERWPCFMILCAGILFSCWHSTITHNDSVPCLNLLYHLEKPRCSRQRVHVVEGRDARDEHEG